MNKLKAFLKVVGLLVLVLAIASFWFVLGSYLTGLVFSAGSQFLQFFFVLLTWYFFNVTIKLIKLTGKYIHVKYE